MKFFHLSDLHIGLKLMNHDLREDQELAEAVVIATRGTPKAAMLQDAWQKALTKEIAAHRYTELGRIYRLIEAAVGTAAKF